ncbi:Cathepsin Z [Pelomyxa schiedti]|nr:Cathepsin Z [Pelomyxa schiedti]
MSWRLAVVWGLCALGLCSVSSCCGTHPAGAWHKLEAEVVSELGAGRQQQPGYVGARAGAQLVAAAPESYDLRNVDGISYVGPIRSQMVPIYCGSCWAFAATSCINDRLKLYRKNAFTDVMLSPQALLNCGNAGDCDGGSSLLAFKYMYEVGIPDESCAPYQAAKFVCDPISQCRFCNDWDQGCTVITNYPVYKVSAYGFLEKDKISDMEQAMKDEIYNNGPIACNMATYPEWDWYTDGIIMAQPYNNTNHLVAVSGWDTDPDSGVPYWIVRNSFGSFWGMNGWFYIERGVNALGIESGCAWADPLV